MRNNAHEYHLYLPPNLWAKLKRLADENRRKVNGEIIIALEAHVKANSRRKKL